MNDKRQMVLFDPGILIVFGIWAVIDGSMHMHAARIFIRNFII